MIKRWFILFTIISYGFCYFDDPFNQGIGDIGAQYDSDSVRSRVSSQLKSTSEALFPRFDSKLRSYRVQTQSDHRTVKKKGLASLPKKEPRPIISSKLVDGSPKHFKQIVIGRCWDYQARIGLTDRAQIDCLTVWNYFKQAFAFKGPCEVTTNDYLSFIEKIQENVPKDKALLWTGCRDLAHKLSDFKYSRRFTTLEDTLAGYMFTGLTWCGRKEPPGINFESCPYQCSIQAPFWAMANYKFAQKVEGIVHVLLNGTRRHINDGNVYPSYMKDRYYFGPYVIPTLNSKKVTEVRILVAHTLKMKPLEHCGEASILELQNELMKNGMKVTCYDDPDIVKHILCVDYPMLEGCGIRRG